jgi:GAF domain-containing protein
MRDNPRLRSITERAAALLNVPIAAISIVDGDRQWFPAQVGLEMDETPRDASFCAHAILDPDHTLVVQDATKDSRFCANPLVTGEPRIRFYMGVPIVTAEGAPLGAICAIDREARPSPSEEHEQILRGLAQEAMEEIQKIGNLRRFGADAIELILEQMRQAAQQENEPLVLELDQILQKLEERLGSASTSR